MYANEREGAVKSMPASKLVQRWHIPTAIANWLRAQGLLFTSTPSATDVGLPSHGETAIARSSDRLARSWVVIVAVTYRTLVTPISMVACFEAAGVEPANYVVVMTALIGANLFSLYRLLTRGVKVVLASRVLFVSDLVHVSGRGGLGGELDT